MLSVPFFDVNYGNTIMSGIFGTLLRKGLEYVPCLKELQDYVRKQLPNFHLPFQILKYIHERDVPELLYSRFTVAFVILEKLDAKISLQFEGKS
jgi:hypothetical protein